TYNAPKSEDDIDSFRYTQFIKSTRLNKPVQLSSLPPSSTAARQHILRCNGQSCLNASSTSDGFNEESEYAPDILESFYSDNLVNENDDNESDIEQPEEEEEEGVEEEEEEEEKKKTMNKKKIKTKILITNNENKYFIF
ncbi:hypothetical protein J6590_107691, partial [Homalodisca vitripennis]